MRIGKIIIIFIWTIPVLLVLSTVLIVSKDLANGVVSGKYFWFYGSMGLVAIATVIHSIIRRQTFRFWITDVFVLLFAGSVFLSSCVFNEASANTKLTLFALLLVLYFCIRIITPKSPKGDLAECSFKAPFRGSGVVEFIIFTGSFFNPGPFAGYLAVVFPLALYELRVKRDELRVKNEKDKKFSTLISSLLTHNSYLLTLSSSLLTLSSIIAIILVLPAAMSRASWLAAIAGAVVVVIPRLTRDPLKNIWGLRVKPAMTKVKFKPAMTGMVIILLACSALLGMYYLKKDSADGRLLTWKVSLSVLAKHPLGVGLGHFPSAYGDAQAAYFASGKASETEEYVAGSPEYGFNEFLQIAIESAIVSLLLFITLLVFACFSYPFSILPFPIIFVFLLAISGNGTQMTRIEQIDTDKRLKSVLISLICVICVPLILYRQYPVYQAYRQWNNSRMYYQAGGMYKEAAQNYEPLYPYLNDQIQFLFEYGRSLAQVGISQGIVGQARKAAGIVLTKEPKVQSQAVKEMREEAKKLGIRN